MDQQMVVSKLVEFPLKRRGKSFRKSSTVFRVCLLFYIQLYLLVFLVGIFNLARFITLTSFLFVCTRFY